MRYLACVLVWMVSVSAAAQRIPLDSLDSLAEKAGSVTQIDLPQELLSLGAEALSLGSDEAVARDLVADLEGIYIRAFEDIDWSEADLDPIRSQLAAPSWTRIVTVTEDDEEVGVWMQREAAQVMGMFVLITEPDEVVAVNIVGPLDPEDLANLLEHFGVGDLGL